MLVNWKVKYCSEIPTDKQPPDYYVKGLPYWFFRYFNEIPEVDVMDVSSFKWIEKFEKKVLRFHLLQALKAIPKLNKYDIIISHGMQSGVVISLWRRFFKSKSKHIVFDIGSFNSAAQSGLALKLMQFASKSIDWVIYHTSSQIEYYKNFFPHIVNKSTFIRFGTDLQFFNPEQLKKSEDSEKYIICVGYAKRDWDTLVQAYTQVNTNIKLRLIGHTEEKYKGIKGVEQVPFIPIKELINQIYNAKFCVLPLKSFNYSYGQMTLMQQMALGKCVIAAKVPSLVDYIKNGETALLYEPNNKNDLMDKIKLAIDNYQLRTIIGINGKKFLTEFCNEQIMAKQIEKCLIDNLK